MGAATVAVGAGKVVVKVASSGADVVAGATAEIAMKAGRQLATEQKEVIGGLLGVKGVITPYGPALQSSDAVAIAARTQVENGATLYRVGTTGKSQAAEAQFWALEHPSTPGFAQRYGIPAENVQNLNFIEAATLKPGTTFVTRPAPGVGTNVGGGIEVVVPEGGVQMKWFSSQ